MRRKKGTDLKKLVTKKTFLRQYICTAATTAFGDLTKC